MNHTERYTGPLFFVVYEVGPSVWSSVAYWSSLEANRRRLKLEALGKLAFVEAR